MMFCEAAFNLCGACFHSISATAVDDKQRYKLSVNLYLKILIIVAVGLVRLATSLDELATPNCSQ